MCKQLYFYMKLYNRVFSIKNILNRITIITFFFKFIFKSAYLCCCGCCCCSFFVFPYNYKFKLFAFYISFNYSNLSTNCVKLFSNTKRSGVFHRHILASNESIFLFFKFIHIMDLLFSSHYKNQYWLFLSLII